LKPKVAAIVLVVPGSSAWFRADPTGLAYLSASDEGPQSASRLNWAPLICIHGSLETDSLCPLIHGPNLRSVTLPGGHFLRRDHDLLVNTILRQLKPIIQ
jgi:type IV secretory pathway VirJ component